MLNEVREVGITQATIEALHQLRHEWHETSYLLEASCMLVADKTSRSYAAGIWTDRVSTGCIDSARIGRILGSHQRTGWGPLNRLDTTANDKRQPTTQPGTGAAAYITDCRTSGTACQGTEEAAGNIFGTAVCQQQQSNG